MSAAPTAANLSRYLPQQAAAAPHKRAVVFPHGRDRSGRVSYTHLTFGQLLQETETFARGLHACGVRRGMRAVLMVRPGLEFLPLTFALFRLGAVPVLIDPGMGRRNLLRCIEQVQPQVFIGIPLAHLIRCLWQRPFRTVDVFVTIGRRWLWGGSDLQKLRQHSSGPVPTVETVAEDMAAIVFTTGSTGPPKGVVYTHGMFEAQRDLLQQAFQIGGDDVDMPGFILFAMYSLSLGMTIVIPDMDPTRPAAVNPERIIEAVADNGVTFSFGSPALWHRVGEHCAAAGVRLPGLKRVVMAGAPVPFALHQRLLGEVLDHDAVVFTPYGATECLPVTSITGAEVLASTAKLTREGAGVCVGRPLPGVEVKIVTVSDNPLRQLADTQELPIGEIGEIIVRGANVSPAYFELPEQTALHKIRDASAADRPNFWHRIGDVGYLDADGRLWFCGRRTHRVVTEQGTLYTVCCEAIANTHPDVYRSALVGVGENRQAQTPVMIVEAKASPTPRPTATRDRLVTEVRELLHERDLTQTVEHVLIHPAFPVDIRHNAKIFREKLRPWAAAQIGLGA